MHKNFFLEFSLAWLPFAAISTLAVFLVYGAVQQNYRQSANSPQIQMAEDAAALLEKGEVPAAVVPRNEQIDVKESLAPFIMVFDNNKTLLESSMKLGGRIPVPLSGTFEHGENIFTWQPEPGVRIASVLMPYEGERPGYVVTGRSLRETEDLISRFGFMALLAWLAMLGSTFVLVFLQTWYRRKN